MKPQQPALFDPDRVGPDGQVRDCPSCRLSERPGYRFINGEWVACANCRTTGRAVIPFGDEAA